MEYTNVSGGVCAAKGFKASGLNCGLNPDKNKFDLALIYSEVPCAAAAVYTQNKVKGAPILVTQRNLAKSKNVAQAVIANSKNANTGNGDGEEKALRMCAAAAEQLGIAPEHVIVASTGVIGQPLAVEHIEQSATALAAGLSEDGHADAAYAIMTTDTVQKEAAVAFELGGKRCVVGGMAKGSGMIHPNMATTLNFVTTDAAVSAELLERALRDVVKVTYNCLSVDGDTSTNDMVSIMANGLSGNRKIEEADADYAVFREALYKVLAELTRMLAKDGEGATKLIECSCTGAPDQDTAITVAKSVVGSSLVKCMIYGEDANCGRILCAIGYADADFDITAVDIDMASAAGTVAVGRAGTNIAFSEELAARVMAEDEIFINIDMHQGSGSAKAWGCDLSYDYVKINGDYRT